MTSTFWGRAFAKVAGFGFSTLLSGVTSALVIPVLIRSAGANDWASLAVGQSVGNVGGVVLGFGWAVAGPTAVAGMKAEHRRGYLKDSLLIRLVAFGPIALPAVVLAAAAPTSDRTACALAALAACSLGLSASWYYVGLSSPRRFLYLETLPRVGATVVGATFVFAGAPLVVYPLIALAGSAVAMLLAVRVVRTTPGTSEPLSYPRAAGIVSRQRPAAATGLLASVYMNLPVIAVSVLAPRYLAPYALADRLFRIANTALTPYTQTIQSWVPGGSHQSLGARCRLAVRATALVAVAAGVAFASLAPPAGLLLSNREVLVANALAGTFAVVLMATTLSQTVGIACLMAFGADGVVARSAFIGSLCALVLLVPAALVAGGEGTAAVVAVCELFVVLYQLNSLRTVVRSGSGG